MSLRVAAAVVVLALGAGRADAGIFGGMFKGKGGLPAPISMITDRMNRSQTTGLVMRHPPKKYSNPSWGELKFEPVARPLRPSARIQ